MKNILVLSFILFSYFAYGQTTFLPKVTINSSTGNSPYAIDSGDIDGDGFADIVIGTFNGDTIEWYKNNGDGTFVMQNLVSNVLSGIVGLKLADLNNDTFLDIIATGQDNSRMIWIENNGSGNFVIQNVISNSIGGASSIAVGDINNDTFIDIAVTASSNDEVLWFSNNGNGSFTLEMNKINTTLNAPRSVNLSDLDGDGDLDAVVTTASDNGAVDVIEIFRNNLSQDSSVSFTKDAVSVATGKYSIFNAIVEDIDGDTNLDILATEISNSGAPNGNLYWYEFDGSSYTETALTTTINNPSIAKFRDLDNDGLNDIVLSSGSSGAGNDLVWFKNNGSGNFEDEAVIDNTQSRAFVYTLNDFDNDGDIDIASCAYSQNDLNYFENQNIVLRVADNDLQTVTIYPNPADDYIYFKGFDGTIDIEIYSLLGQKIINRSVSSGDRIPISNLIYGIYLLKVNNSVAMKLLKK